MDFIMNRYVFNTMKQIGRRVPFLNQRNYKTLLIIGVTLGLSVYFLKFLFPASWQGALTYFFIGLGLLLVFRSFSERHSPLLAWWAIVCNHIFVGIAVSFNEWFDTFHLILFFSGFLTCGVLGSMVLTRIKHREANYFGLNRYYGHVHEHRGLAAVFLFMVMALMGFPITPSFIGEDLILGHVHAHQWVLAFFYAVSYVMTGIALIRIYARIFLGPHVKSYHPVALQTA
jgi:hypothetical protein